MQDYEKNSKKIKSSSKRVEVLKTLFDNKKHMSPDDIYMELKDKENNIGIASIYRILSFLEEAKLIRQVGIDANAKRYEVETGEHHDHLMCSKCGKVVEFFDEDIERLQEKIAQKYGFKLEEHELKLFGICEDCSK